MLLCTWLCTPAYAQSEAYKLLLRLLCYMESNQRTFALPQYMYHSNSCMAFSAVIDVLLPLELRTGSGKTTWPKLVASSGWTLGLTDWFIALPAPVKATSYNLTISLHKEISLTAPLTSHGGETFPLHFPYSSPWLLWSLLPTTKWRGLPPCCFGSTSHVGFSHGALDVKKGSIEIMCRRRG